MPVDYAAAFRDGCKESPRAVSERTEVEDVVAQMCATVTAEAAKVFRARDVDEPAVVLVCFSQVEERAEFNVSSIPDAHSRVYVMHSSWSRVRDVPAHCGVEILTYRRGPMGYPVKLTSFDGSEAVCQTRQQLEASLANILRAPHTGARIRRAAKDFAARPLDN